nr:hypothetical protein [Tanacetum cinerariifolium]
HAEKKVVSYDKKRAGTMVYFIDKLMLERRIIRNLERLVPKADRVKISTTNLRIDPTITQKEETYQVVLDIIKNTTLYKAFLATADVSEIYMQQFWHTVTKIKESTFYKFKLANKKCQFDVEVFRKALEICPRFKGKEFITPSSEEELLTFLIGLGYKGELTHLPKKLIDHMHQPWRTLASIINKCLSGKTSSNDKLHYKAFIEYSTCLVPPKKTKGKVSKGKKQEVTTKKKTVITIDDNIITIDPDVAFELGNSISKTDVEIADETRLVHDTHACFVTKKAANGKESKESDGELAHRLIAMTDMEKNVAKKTEEEQGDEEQAKEALDDDDKDQKDQADDDIIGTLKSSTSKESSKGKTLPKTSKTGKSIHTKETVEEATYEVAMDIEEPTQKNTENNDDQP